MISVRKFDEVQEHMRLAGGWEIFRRYLVMNAFDGLLSVFGVVMGAFLLEVTNPRQVIIPGLGAAIAIGVSGSWIAYLMEQAENEREQRILEQQILTNLDDSRIAKATHTASIVNSIINGLSPLLFGSLTLVPFLFAELIPITTAFYISFGLNASFLFILGLFLGNISEQNVWIFGVKTVFAGVVVAIFLYFL